ncbi:MAG: protein kinase [Labilithrix sp.]
MSDIKSGGTYFLGRYRVVDEIGIGGMASVHLARMDGPGGFQKWVAIKKIHSHLVEDDSFVQMFLDEARVAARISHPNVATVFDLGKHEDTYWIAMEYLHGEPLREVMRRTEELGTAMPPEIACRVIADAAEGLHAAHELLGKNGEKLGLVHRDVTPHNLFVTYDGVTKVVDFGIAKFSSRMSHTRAGTLKGKLAYMSPEQVHGEGIDRRTDIFALGVVLWELTTGQRLFRMESDLDTLAKVQECNVPRPSTLIRGYPVDLEKIVMKALAKNRGERFKTARELSRALQSLLMRRGLFIASDEVAAYTQQIFSDRIQKREAHLRWAAEVTQTINVDQLLSKPKLNGEYTNSEDRPVAPPKPSPAAGPPPAPRPAAGAPAPLPAAGAPPNAWGQMPPPGPQILPDDAKETAASLTTPRAPAGPISTGPRGRPPPRPAAGAPISAAIMDDDHPADGDGPTIQGSAIEPSGPYAAGGMDPPTLMHISEADRPKPARGAPARSASEVLEADELDDGEGDQTIVGNSRQRDPAAGPSFPQPPPPAAGRQPTAQPLVLGSVPTPPRPNAERIARLTGPVPQAASTAPSQPAFAHPQSFSGQIPNDYPSERNMPPQSNPHPHMGMGGGGGYGPDNGYDTHAMPMYGRNGASPSGPQDFAPMHPGMPGQNLSRIQPTVQRLPHPDNRTMTAQRLKRRPPMWVVAALSCSVALLVAGILIAILSTTSPAPRQPQAGSPVGSNTGAAMVGPFSQARTAFLTAAAPPPAPPPLPPGPTGGVMVPPNGTPAAPASVALAPTTPTAPPVAPTDTVATRPTGQPTQPPAPQPAPAPLPQPKPNTTPPPKPGAMGSLTVVCLPMKCDQIIDNGTPLGPGHIFSRPVPAGRHALVLSAPNGVKKSVTVEVLPDQLKDVRMSMNP